MSLASNVAKKKRSRGAGRKTHGLSTHIIPPPVLEPSATSKTVPVAQAHRGLQKSKSGSGEYSSSPNCEKHRKLPPSTPAQSYHRFRLSRRHQQTSQGGTSVSSLAESKGARPKDQRGVRHSGSSQSSSHHERTNQGQGSSASSDPPRPMPSATITSGTLAANTLGQVSGGVSGQSGQHNWQPEERDWTVVNKVRYSFCWSIENYRLLVCLNPCKGLSNKILLNSFNY